MGVGVDCKQEDTSNGDKTLLSAIDTGKSTPSTATATATATASKTKTTTTTAMATSMSMPPIQPFPIVLPTSSKGVNVNFNINSTMATSVEPPSKRVKLENEATTYAPTYANATTAKKNSPLRTSTKPAEVTESAHAANDTSTTSAAGATTTLAGSFAHNIVEISKDAATKASTSIPKPNPSITKSNSPLGTSTKPIVATESAHAGNDTSTTSAAGATETGTATQPQHAQTPKTVPVHSQQQPQGKKPHTLASTCPQVSAEVSRSVVVKNEESSSNIIQRGSPSVVTASDDCIPQNTSNSDNTCSNSSNYSLQESATPPATNTPAASATSATKLPNAPTGAVPLPVAAAALSIPPKQPSPAIAIATTATFSTKNTPPLIRPTTQSAPARTHVPPYSAPSAAPVSHTIANAPNSTEVPLKSLNFGHLRIKYLGELEYMLREFRKLERQLLGAKGAQQLEESQGSRERREKLHSFILHLEDTIRQIELSCKSEGEGKSAIAEHRKVSATATSTPATNSTNNGDASAAATIDHAAEDAKKQLAEESALSNLTKEKEEEETVQKLEEHILANLLPVKVRLKKQLAAQQGATQNPPGMPARRGSLQPSSAARGKGTFVEAVEKKRKHAESLRLAAQAQHDRQVRSVTDPTQFGKPLSGVGSSLTKKLHGSTLGSSQRRTGHGVGGTGAIKDGQERKILHAGMVPKSTQQESGLSAASGVHEIVTTSSQNQNNTTKLNNKSVPVTAVPAAAATAVKPAPAQTLQGEPKNSTIATKPKPTIAPKVEPTAAATAATTKNTSSTTKQEKGVDNSSNAPLSEEDKLKFKKNRRMRKLKRLKRRRERELARQQQSKTQQQIQSTVQSIPSPNVVRKKPCHSKAGQKKKGPRVVEYICSQCSEAYSSNCEYNPWWALAQHKCPKCHKTQVPRIDISSPANTIEYHPALLSHLEDGGRGGGGTIPPNGAQAVVPAMPIVSQIPVGANDVNSESDSDLSELSDDNISIGSLKAAELESDLQSMTPAERAEHETFGSEYEGPVFPNEHAAKLLILIGHAATCPCQHKSEKQRDICRSVKYMMLHVRDCPGTTSTFDVCPFPWCRKVKHLLYHLVACAEPDQCTICSPSDLPKGLKELVGLNAHRMKKHRQRTIAIAKATLAAKSTKPNAATKKPTTTKKTAPAPQINICRKVTPNPRPPSVTISSTSDPSPAVQKPPPVPVPAPAPTPVVQKIDSLETDVPFASSISGPSVDTEDKINHRVQISVATKRHPATEALTGKIAAQPRIISDDLHLDMPKGILELETLMCTGIKTERPSLQESFTGNPFAELKEMNPSFEDVANVTLPQKVGTLLGKEAGTSTTVPMTTDNVKSDVAACPPTNYTTMHPSKAMNELFLPTPTTAIKMEDHDDHTEELIKLDLDNFLEEPDRRNQPIKNNVRPYDLPDCDIFICDDHDLLGIEQAHRNHTILSDPSEVLCSKSEFVATTTAKNNCVNLKQNYSEATTSTSVQPASSVSTATAT